MKTEETLSSVGAKLDMPPRLRETGEPSGETNATTDAYATRIPAPSWAATLGRLNA